jgi:hypothetical protein
VIANLKITSPFRTNIPLLELLNPPLKIEAGEYEDNTNAG